MRRLTFALTVSLSLTAGRAAIGQTVAYSNFRVNDAYAPGLSRLSFSGTPGWRFAQPFTASAGGRLQWIDAGFFSPNAAPELNRTFQFFVYSDAGGAPGASLGSFTAIAPASVGINSGLTDPPVRYLPSGAAIDLNSGSRYWLGIGSERFVSASDFAWLVSDDSIASPRAQLIGGSWQVSTPAPAWQGSMRIVVPAPGTAAVVALGAAIGFGLGRRRARRSPDGMAITASAG